MDLHGRTLDLYGRLGKGVLGDLVRHDVQLEGIKDPNRLDAHHVEDLAVRRNVVFVQWASGRRRGVDIVSWDQDGLVANWTRSEAETEA